VSEQIPRFDDLTALRAYMGDCHRCDLGDTRANLVFGDGNPHAEVMFIGEAPGRNEDLRGKPFVGAAGHLLDELLSSIGLSRSDVYIANVLKSRPPNNRDPLPAEIEACTPFLNEQIRLVDPKVIVTLGKFATQFMLKTERGITQLRGRRHEVDGRAVLPIFHPAAALYDQSKRDVLLDDFKRLAVLLKQEEAHPGDVLGVEPSRAAEGEPSAPAASDTQREPDKDPARQGQSADEPEQGTLF
jgi:uracil-DNA glycosylase family 4